MSFLVLVLLIASLVCAILACIPPLRAYWRDLFLAALALSVLALLVERLLPGLPTVVR
jgi:hypothetical protein